MLYNICCRNKCGNVHYSFNFIFFNPIVKKQEIALSQFFICFSKPLDLSLIRFKKKIKIYTPDEIQGQSKGSEVNPINNAPISN